MISSKASNDCNFGLKYLIMLRQNLKYFLILNTIVYFGKVATSYAQVPEGSIPAESNINPNSCPCILEDLSVLFIVQAPNARSLQIDLVGKLYDMDKSGDGLWSVKTAPQDPGFHYYSLVIDGIKVADPASESFFGMGRMASGIEIPEKGVDFYSLKEVPRGEIRSISYFSTATESWRNINIYTPPGYDQNHQDSYPVLYIQHGGGEDERGWAIQGKTNIIMDNLIAEGKAVPMVVVIPNGNVTKPGTNVRGYTDEAMDAFKEELFDNIIPFIETNYRVKTTPESRALSGLSMGGGQAFYTGLRNRDHFDYVGIFSTGLFGGIREAAAAFNPETIIPGMLSQAQAFNESLKVFYISVGEQDQRITATQKLIKKLEENGVNVAFATFPGDHEWQVWRKSLHDFAQRIFKD
jgi:enterochelin esterase-like enzyme